MNAIDINKLRVIAGIRFEGTNLTTGSATFDPNGNFLGLLKSSGSYLNVLPSAALRYDLGHDTYFRLAYARGLSRPDPQEIAQAVSYTPPPGDGSPGSATISNPNLKAERADHFDLLIEHYLNPFGMITGGFFYRNLYSPLVEQTFIQNNYTPAPNAPEGSYRVS